MPRKPSVPHQAMADAIILAKEELVNKTTQSILGPTSEVWKKLALNLNNMVSPRYIYQYVKENRHDIQGVLGLNQTWGTSSPTYTTTTYSDTDTSTIDVEEVTQMVQPKKTFVIIFSPEDWRTIQPIETVYKRKDRPGTRVRTVLPPNWSNKVVEKLWDGHKLPCPYTINHGNVTSGEDTEYIKISAKCKECGARATGVVLFKPIEGESVSLTWRAPDTRKVPHQKSRWLSGPQREKVGQELKRSCASVYRRELAYLNMDQGDPKPPMLYSNAVLRKVKQEAREKELETRGHGSPINSLVSMKHSPRYAGTIHDIGIDKFFVHYYSHAQLFLYKKHCGASYTKLTVDATGTLVKKIVHAPEQKSGHIFLYESILTSMPKSGGRPESIPVTQMLSEKHDTNSIVYWLNEWRRAGAPVPHEVVIDNSAALKSAVARVFVGVDIKTYINTCFTYLEGGGELPKTYLRLDVAHYIKAACEWQVWADRKRIKDFYMRCLGILMNAETLKEFTERLMDILTVATSPCKADSAGNDFPVAECLSRLAKVMRDQKIEFCEPEPEGDQVRLADGGDIELAPNVDRWLTAIKNQVITYDDPEGELNPYHLPGVLKEFYRTAAEFVLWSSVLTRGFGSPFQRGTSSPVESYFSDLKCNILKGESKPLRVDNFVATHITAIEGACRISNTTFDNQREVKTIKDSASDDLNQVENWRGLGAPNPKRSKYLSVFPGAEIAIASANYKFAAQGVLRNGTGKAVTTSDGTVLLISNTCSFDALCHVVTNAYLTFNSYRDQMAGSDNAFIKTAISLGHNGPVKETYVKRAEALAPVLELKGQLNMPETRRRTLALEYDAYGNAANLLNKMIPPHTSQEVMCEVETHRIKRMIVEANTKTLFEQGWGGLGESLQNSRQQCAQCSCSYGDHIFVDVEFFSDDNVAKRSCYTARLYALSEVPKQLSLGNDLYTLTGIVAYEQLHYVAYCFSVCIWRKYDDLFPKESKVEETTRIWPAILMYVK